MCIMRTYGRARNGAGVGVNVNRGGTEGKIEVLYV